MKNQMSLRAFALAWGMSMAIASFGCPVAADEPSQAPPEGVRADSLAPAASPQVQNLRDVALSAGGRMEEGR